MNLEKIKEKPQLRHDILFLSMIIIKFKEVHSINTAISLLFIAQNAVKARIIENGPDLSKEVKT